MNIISNSNRSPLLVNINPRAESTGQVFSGLRGKNQARQLPPSLLQKLISQLIAQLIYALLNREQNQSSSFNDVIRGSDSGEVIKGLRGNDQLYGNGGDDILKGGAGNDQLYGGSGNDELIGGAGNDYLEDNSGNNRIVGGSGVDTVRFTGKFSDYRIEKDVIIGLPESALAPGDYNGFIITNKATGERNVIESVDKFKFSDANLTAGELTNLVDYFKEVVLTDAQMDGVRQQFDIGSASSYRILDRDGSGSLSVGDELEITIGGDAISTVILTAGEIEAINHPVQKLNLTDQQQNSLSQYFDHGTIMYTGNVVDKDGSGTLSAGDVVKLRIGGFAGNLDIDYVLTQQDLNRINNNAPQALNLTAQQKDNLNNYFNKGTTIFSGNVIDKDGSGTLSAGDIVKLTVGGYLGNANIDHILSLEDLNTINSSSFPQKLNLTPAQQDAIGARFNKIPPPNLYDGISIQYKGVVLDKNGDGKLNVGDIVKLHEVGGFAGFNNRVDHVLTAEDFVAIEADRSHPLLDISNGLSSEQKQRLHTALFSLMNFISVPEIDSVYDRNLDNKISVGDIVVTKTFSESMGRNETGYVELTQDHINQLLSPM